MNDASLMKILQTGRNVQHDRPDCPESQGAFGALSRIPVLNIMLQTLNAEFHIDIIDGERRIATQVRNQPSVPEDRHNVVVPLFRAQFLDSSRFVFNVFFVDWSRQLYRLAGEALFSSVSASEHARACITFPLLTTFIYV